MEATTYAAAVGAFLRAFRGEHGITLESIALRGREYGATWSLSSVQAIEAGKASPTLPTLLTLALVLGAMTGRPLRLIDLLGPAEAFDRPFSGQLERPVRRTLVERALGGHPVQLEPADLPATEPEGAGPTELDVESPLIRDLPFGRDEDDEAGRGAVLQPAEAQQVDMELHAELLRRGSGPLTAEERRAAFNQTLEESQMPPEDTPDELRLDTPATLAEKRAADRLGVPVEQLRRLAQDLWGRSIEDESAYRAGPGSSPQARGRVTRVLVAEVRGMMDEGR